MINNVLLSFNTPSVQLWWLQYFHTIYIPDCISSFLLLLLLLLAGDWIRGRSDPQVIHRFGGGNEGEDTRRYHHDAAWECHVVNSVYRGVGWVCGAFV